MSDGSSNKPLNAQRRKFLRAVGATGLATSLSLSASESAITRKIIPGTDESIPCIGMGTWLTFDVPDKQTRDKRTDVLQSFFSHGGGMIDSSPMYGHSEAVVGYCLSKLNYPDSLFAASKIWTPGRSIGVKQMAGTETLWGIQPVDLMQVHNLLAWKKHLPNLRKWKDEGRVRYIGVSTSHGRRHDEMEQFLKSEPVDFVQLTYNIDNTRADQRLLPLAQDLGIGVIVNRPFARGALIKRYGAKPLPGVAKELGCSNWAQFLLLYVVSHPAVTCAIPATTRVDHMRENMGTLQITLPDQAARLAMQNAVG